MIRLDDDASDAELAEETSGGAEAVAEKLNDAQDELQAERHSQEDAAESAYSVRQLAEDIARTAQEIEESLGDAKTHGDRGFDLTEEAADISNNVSHHAAMLEERIDQGETPVAEAEVELAGVEYRVRFDPMEEAETGEPIHHRDPNDE